MFSATVYIKELWLDIENKNIVKYGVSKIIIYVDYRVYIVGWNFQRMAEFLNQT